MGGIVALDFFVEGAFPALLERRRRHVSGKIRLFAAIEPAIGACARLAVVGAVDHASEVKTIR